MAFSPRTMLLLCDGIQLFCDSDILPIILGRTVSALGYYVMKCSAVPRRMLNLGILKDGLRGSISWSPTISQMPGSPSQR